MLSCPNARSVSLAVAAALSCTYMLSACGGSTDEPRPEHSPASIYPEDPGSGPFSCAVDDDVEVMMLVDFEGGTAQSGWYTNNDVCYVCEQLQLGLDDDIRAAEEDEGEPLSAREKQAREADIEACNQQGCVAAQRPSKFAKPIPAELLNEPRCGESHYALHFWTVTLSDWGATFGGSLGTVDASDYEGISFWARRAPGSESAIRVQVGDRFNDGKYLDPATGEPLCYDDVPEDDPSEGCDKFGGYATLSQDWQFFKLPFDELRQAGWGKQSAVLEVWALRLLEVSFNVGHWDVWIDDIGFYRKKGE